MTDNPNQGTQLPNHLMLPGDRLFTPINDLLIILAAVAHAASHMVGGEVHKSQSNMSIGTTQYDYAFVLPLTGSLENALAAKFPPYIEIGMTRDDVQLKSAKLSTTGLDGPLVNLFPPIFLLYFERYNEWLNDKYGRNSVDQWPPTLNFARVIRNAAAHGSVHFRDPNASPVSWRKLTNGPKDNGRKLIGDDLRPGDMLGLMFEINDELNKLAAPIL